MREIIHIQIGHCGNTIGTKFWETIFEEHLINRDHANHSVYFKEVKFNRIPRAVCIGMDSKSIASMTQSCYKSLYRPENCIFDENPSKGNFGKAYLTEGACLLQKALDVIRVEAEACDSIQQFQILHSIGGGCGSGTTSLLLMKLRDEYKDQIIQTYSIFPSQGYLNRPFEVYNAILGLRRLIEYPSNVICFDNQALGEFCKPSFVKPEYEGLNRLIANVIAGVTASLRFPGTLNTNARKLHTNLLPYPNLHFMLPSYLTAKDGGVNDKTTMLTCESRKYLTLALLFRGNVQLAAIDNYAKRLQKIKASAFIDWIPHNIFTDLCEIPPPGEEMTATLLGNNTGFRMALMAYLQKFLVLYRKRAHLHCYKSEGMDESDFILAHEKIQQLVNDYVDLEMQSVEVGGDVIEFGGEENRSIASDLFLDKSKLSK